MIESIDTTARGVATTDDDGPAAAVTASVNNDNCNNLDTTTTTTIITPKPSMIFSTTTTASSSSSSSAASTASSSDDDRRNNNSNDDKQAKQQQQQQQPEHCYHQIGLDIDNIIDNENGSVMPRKEDKKFLSTLSQKQDADIDDDNSVTIEKVVRANRSNNNKNILTAKEIIIEEATGGTKEGKQHDENETMIMTTMTTTKCSTVSSPFAIIKSLMKLIFLHLFLYISMTVYYQCTHRVVLLKSEFRTTTRTTPPASTTEAMIKYRKKMIAKNNDDVEIDENCVYVPGGGFSGFWYLLGRLQGIQQRNDIISNNNNISNKKENNQKVVCYSAGCLVVIATFLEQEEEQQQQHYYHGGGKIDDHPAMIEAMSIRLNNTATTYINNKKNKKKKYKQQLDSLYELARSVQIEYENGRLHRYQICEAFVDRLLSLILKPSSSMKEEESSSFMQFIRNDLYILTTTYDDSFLTSKIPKASMRRPTDVTSLRRMLLQTSWIPYATGSSRTYDGHMDGVFSMLSHPKCKIHLGDYYNFVINASYSTAKPLG